MGTAVKKKLKIFRRIKQQPFNSSLYSTGKEAF
jgi:hypothetical protein